LQTRTPHFASAEKTLDAIIHGRFDAAREEFGRLIVPLNGRGWPRFHGVRWIAVTTVTDGVYAALLESALEFLHNSRGKGLR
jgi:hypothetical protein